MMEATRPSENQHIVKKSILIRARPEQVWNALTQPEMTKKYFYKTEVHSNWKVGSPIAFTRKILWKTFSLNGLILSIEPGRLLQYSLKSRKGPSKSLVTDRLIPEGDQTRLEITDDVGTDEGFEKRYQKSIKGWDKVLAGLKQVVEKR